MSGIAKLSSFYWVFWVTVVCVAIMYMFIRSRFGRTVKAIREDYVAASASGVNVTFYKVMTFTVSAFFAAQVNLSRLVSPVKFLMISGEAADFPVRSFFNDS